MIEKAQRKNQNAYIVTFLLFLVFATSFAFLVLRIGDENLFRFLGIASVIFFSGLSKRYIVNGYEYFLTPSDEMHEKNDFAVVRSFGKGRAVVCNISLFDVSDARQFKNRKEFLSFMKERKRKFDYCPDLFPKESTAITVSDNGVEAVIIIQCSDAFFCELKSRIFLNNM